jgi:outer membrane protein OmpA-like peptidoglycan-associated protein/tetratricopeptide (TPR) repeat protein
MIVLLSVSKLARILFIASWVILFIPIEIRAQISEDQFDKLINDGNFEKAIELGEKLIKKHPKNPRLNFKLGYSYLNIPTLKSKSIEFLQKSDELYNNSISQAAIETRYYLGKALHKNYKFDEAIAVFEKLQEQTKNPELLSSIDHDINTCHTAKSIVRRPVNVVITNLGSMINSPFYDHSPVLDAEESKIIFTSRRKKSENQVVLPGGQYSEDLLISHFDGNEWSKPETFLSNANATSHRGSIGLSADGQKLFIYSPEDAGTILTSYLVGDKWAAPVKLNENINTRYRETHATISADGKYLYFTSDRLGGFGGLDIYVSELQENDTWGPAKNLGPTINTEKDEEGPFIHHDGITLYFSSKGHRNMGGYDIFMSKKSSDTTWLTPQNLGYPINTTEDDVFFTTTADGKRAYFSSYRTDGSGGLDLYVMGMPEAEEKPLTIVNGNIVACKSDVSRIEIKVKEEGNPEFVGVYKPNTSSGKYLFVLNRGKKYEIIYYLNNKVMQKENLEIDPDAEFQIIYKQIDLRILPCNEIVGKIEDSKDIEEMVERNIQLQKKEEGKTYIEDIVFKINTATIDYYHENLKKLARYLKNNTGTKIEIIGYTDMQGPETYNYHLSKLRAKNVYTFLIKQGVNPSQLEHRGIGFENLLTINSYEDGSYIWQSLPYNRRVEFIIISDPPDNLRINRVKTPEVYHKNNKSFTKEAFKKYDNIFAIQIGAFSKPIGPEHFPKLEDIQMYYNGKLYYYTVGEFVSEENATDELPNIQTLGYKDAFIRPLSFYFPKHDFK